MKAVELLALVALFCNSIVHASIFDILEISTDGNLAITPNQFKIRLEEEYYNYAETNDSGEDILHILIDMPDFNIDYVAALVDCGLRISVSHLYYALWNKNVFSQLLRLKEHKPVLIDDQSSFVGLLHLLLPSLKFFRTQEQVDSFAFLLEEFKMEVPVEFIFGLIEDNDVEFVHLIHKHNNDFDVRVANHALRKNASGQMLSLLIDLGMDANQVCDGISPLSKAVDCSGKALELVKKLLAKGACVEFSSRQVRSIIEKALFQPDTNQRISIVLLLFFNGAERSNSVLVQEICSKLGTAFYAFKILSFAGSDSGNLLNILVPEIRRLILEIIVSDITNVFIGRELIVSNELRVEYGDSSEDYMPEYSADCYDDIFYSASDDDTSFKGHYVD